MTVMLHVLVVSSVIQLTLNNKSVSILPSHVPGFLLLTVLSLRAWSVTKLVGVF